MPRWPPDAQWEAAENANRVVSGDYSMHPRVVEQPQDSETLRQIRHSGGRPYVAGDLALPSTEVDDEIMNTDPTHNPTREFNLHIMRNRLLDMEENEGMSLYGPQNPDTARHDAFADDAQDIPRGSQAQGPAANLRGSQPPPPPTEFTMQQAHNIIHSNVAAEIRDAVSRGISEQLYGGRSITDRSGWRRRPRELGDVGGHSGPNYDANMRATHDILGALPRHDAHQS